MLKNTTHLAKNDAAATADEEPLLEVGDKGRSKLEFKASILGRTGCGSLDELLAKACCCCLSVERR